MAPKGRKGTKIQRRLLDINLNIIPGLLTCPKNKNWEYKRTQRDLTCYYHKQFEQSPDYNYHISVWNRQRETDDRVDHHATLFIRKNGIETKIHYGWKRSNEKIFFEDNIDRNDPKQLKLIQLFEKFEADKKDLLKREILNRLNVHKN